VGQWVILLLYISYELIEWVKFTNFLKRVNCFSQFSNEYVGQFPMDSTAKVSIVRARRGQKGCSIATFAGGYEGMIDH
jgi:hypothetical protein